MATKRLTALPDTLGKARLVGHLENNTPEWHELRQTGIGGSDVAGILGVSPWNSPYKVWAVKTGKIDDSFTPSEAAEWGNRLEAVVLDKFEESHPELKVHRNVGTWANTNRPWQLANPDALYETKDGKFGIIEIKTSRYEDDWQNNQPPLHYQTQVHWYDSTFGFNQPIYVAALFSGSKYVEYVVEPDQFAQDTYLAEVEKFREFILEDRKPDFDGSLATYETVRTIHPEIEPDSDLELGDLGMHYIIACNDFAKAESHLNEMKSRVLDAMGNAKRGLVNDEVIVTRQARGAGKPYLVNKKGA